MLHEKSFGTVLAVTNNAPSDWENALGEIQDHSFDHVEVWLEASLTEQETRHLGGLLTGISCTMHAPFVDVSLSSHAPETRAVSQQRVLAAVDVANEIGAHVITIHSGKYPVFTAHEQALDNLASSYERIANYLAEDAKLAVENVKAKTSGVSRETVATADDVRAFLGRISSAFVTIDTGHALQNGDDPVELLDEFRDQTASIHLHDARHGGRSHYALGKGDLELAPLANALAATPTNFITIETLTVADAVRSRENIVAHL